MSWDALGLGIEVPLGDEQVEPSPGSMGCWITDRIYMDTIAPTAGSSWDHWITDRLPLQDLVE